jgi:hypothetical protein
MKERSVQAHGRIRNRFALRSSNPDASPILIWLAHRVPVRIAPFLLALALGRRPQRSNEPREVSIVRHRQRHPQIAGGDHKHDSAAYCLMINELDPALCEYGCKRITPYGYVQNASCPRHD